MHLSMSGAASQALTRALNTRRKPRQSAGRATYYILPGFACVRSSQFTGDSALDEALHQTGSHG